MLHEYQRPRILIFLDPERDPLGTGYHILQSMIALGSGGIWGKGFMLGTQSHLNFLPEKQTDFIFTMLAEEFGMVGALALIGLFVCVLVYGFAIALRARNHFARLLSLGVTINLFLYVFINIAMVIGLIPVVGVPLPLISYGGTVMLSLMVSYGLMMSAYIHRDQRISRAAGPKTERGRFCARQARKRIMPVRLLYAEHVCDPRAVERGVGRSRRLGRKIGRADRQDFHIRPVRQDRAGKPVPGYGRRAAEMIRAPGVEAAAHRCVDHCEAGICDGVGRCRSAQLVVDHRSATLACQPSHGGDEAAALPRTPA